jgi:hypothetical protein
LESEIIAKSKLNYRTVTIVPKSRPATPKQPAKEEDFWDSYLKNKPVTPTPNPTPPPPRVVVPPPSRANTPSNTNKTNTPSSSSSANKNDSGCTTIIVVGIIGAAILGGLTGNFGGALLGFFIGGGISSVFINSR